MIATEGYGRLKLLFVDDAPHIRLLLREILRGTIWANSEFVDSAAAAFESIKTNQPDLVITDWQMPERNGLELIRDIRERPDSPDPLLPVILLTASNDARHVIEARDAGATGFLLKPVSIGRITAGVVNAVTKQPPFIVSREYKGPERRGIDRPLDENGHPGPTPPNVIVLPADGLLLAKVRGEPRAIRQALRRRAEAIAVVRRVCRSTSGPADATQV